MMAITFTAPPKEAAPTGTKAVVTQTITGKLPGMIRAAADKLATATTAAEILDARDEARMTYSTAQIASRIAKAKGAHDQVVAAAHRAQADALEIEAAAKRRLADEYDAAQPKDAAVKGRPKKSVPVQNAFSAEAVGLTRKDVHDARRVRNAEKASPGVVRQALDQALADGQEPSRAVVNEAVAEVLGETKPARKSRNIFDEMVALWTEATAEDREAFIAYLRVLGFTITESNPATGTGGGHVDRSAERASSAVKVGTTNSNSSATSSRQTSKPEPVFPPAVSGAPFVNPRCQHPDTCHFANSRDCCHDCLMAWAQRPKDEQIRLWAEANEAARAA